jgi:hypothetical protein
MTFTQEEWDAMMANYPPGTPVTGVVTSCQVFGVFVRHDQLPDLPSLLEIIHFAVNEANKNHRIRFPADYPPETLFPPGWHNRRPLMAGSSRAATEITDTRAKVERCRDKGSRPAAGIGAPMS